jgi:hypothetical protein
MSQDIDYPKIFQIIVWRRRIAVVQQKPAAQWASAAVSHRATPDGMN